ncbi:hypothetical protein [Dysgonomonas sp. Marseille-P4361]|uniref:hypothetical protein n=1 Tax=Dysgonomonas sp. Marseille-P4361 TaxID=2161820 RepID=UPI001358B895|nr:hypothetical protein [Dysgonomonas sp. Marseille-P4361]
MSLINIIILFICFNVPIYILIRHFGAKKEESKLLVILSILSSISWVLLIGIFSYLYFASNTGSLISSLPVVLIVLIVILTAAILLIKAIELYKK